MDGWRGKTLSCRYNETGGGALEALTPGTARGEGEDGRRAETTLALQFWHFSITREQSHVQCGERERGSLRHLDIRFTRRETQVTALTNVGVSV